MLEVRVCGSLGVLADGQLLPDALFPGRQGRLAFAYLVCERDRSVRREELAELLWGDQVPESWQASLAALVSRLRRLLGEAGLDGAATLASSGSTYQLLLPAGSVVDLERLRELVAAAEATIVAGDWTRTIAAAGAAEAIAARGFLADDCDWVDRQREVVRDLRVRARLASAEAHLGDGSPRKAIEAARAALEVDATSESAHRLLMQGLAAVGERAEALRVWERCRILLVEELGVDPSPETEAVYLEILGATTPVAEPTPVTTALPSGVVTFLLTDIVESSTLWDKAPEAMAVALERHDAIVTEVVHAHGGALLKSKLEGDATVSVFARASDGAAAALQLHAAIDGEAWPDGAAPKVRMAMHTGEAFERGGDYFGPALNRAARLRSLAGAGDVLLSQAVTELVRDHLPKGVVLRDLGHRDLRGLSRGENIYALVHPGSTADGHRAAPPRDLGELVRPPVPAALVSDAPFVGRGDELTTLVALWDGAVTGAPGAAFIGGEPGVGKSRLAGEIAAHAHAEGGIIAYGRCDEDLSAPLQPFIEALRTLVPALGASRVGSVRGIDELARVVPELAELLPDRPPAVRADPDTERLALFDALTNVVVAASTEAPVLLVLDDLHWAGKTTLSLLRHLLRGTRGARLLVVGTYRDTELARTHPLAETLADLRRDTDATRVSLSGLAAEDIDAYLSALGIDDRALGRELTEITSGNPFFLIEVLRHVEETGGAWTPGNLPEGVREATGRRLSRLSDATNRALSVAAVVGTSFELALVEQAQGSDLVDEIAEACQAGLVVEEAGYVDRFRFAHALVRQVLLAELVTVKRVRLHKRIAELLEAAPVGDDPDARLADLAYHWSECASVGAAGKAVEACRRAADRALERQAYEEAGDLYGMALQVLDDADDPTGDTRATLHLARCDALLTAGDVTSARAAIDALESIAHGSERLAAWYTTYEGLLAVLAEPDRLTEIVQPIAAAAGAMRAIGDLRGEARAHYVHASALERLGQIGAAERALDAALAAARSADDRRLADSILAEAPPAALWGPSSVTRASGRCLDVVRVLRINDGAPAVEPVALRCQAVLEALRGRSDAARRMIGSARRTFERLGLVHRLLETEVMAGLIEIIDDNAPEAERLLRVAYEGLRDRGLGGEAAQAAAFLGRAMLLQHRVDEADEMGAEAEALAGSDLKAAIAWRIVRAEAAAHRGDAARALSLAQEAVDLAAATDALLLVADARLALATVLRATGDERGAAAEARRAIEACEAKGATALAARARGAAPAAAADLPSAGAITAPPVPAPSCAAMDAAIRWHEQFNQGALQELTANRSADFRFADRRSLMADEFGNDGGDGRDSIYLARTYEGGSRFEPPQLLVARERLALLRCEVRAPGAEWSFLVVFGVDTEGRLSDYVMFDAEDRNAANVELDRLTPETLEVDNAAWRAVRRHVVATNAKDMDALQATLAPGFKRIDLRTGMAAEHMGNPTDAHRVLFALDDWAREDSAIELHGDHRVLVHDIVWFRDGAVADAEVASLQVFEVDDDGLIVRQTAWEPTDGDAARTELHRDDQANDVVARAGNAAWRAVERWNEAFNAMDRDALVACFDPDVRQDDRRIAVSAVRGLDEIVQMTQVGFELDELRQSIRLIAVRGEHLALVEVVTSFRDGAAGPSEIASVGIFEVGDGGRIRHEVTFESTALDQALAELDARHHTTEGQRVTNKAWQCSERFVATYNAKDLNALVALHSPGYSYHDRRSTITAVDRYGEEAHEQFAFAMTMEDFHIARDLLATRGEHLALVEERVTFRTGATGAAQVDCLTVFEVDDDGLALRNISFDPTAMDDAMAELDARHAAGDAFRPRANACWRTYLRQQEASDRGSWDAFAATYDPAFEYVDRRHGMWAPAGTDPLGIQRSMFEMDEWSLRRTLLATRGDRLALVRTTCEFRTGAAGPAEVTTVAVVEVGPNGLVVREAAFEPDDIDEAVAHLEARWQAMRERDHATNAAWRAIQALDGWSDARDWDAFIAAFHPDYELVEHRWFSPTSAIGAVENYRVMFSLDEWTLRHELIATRGDRLCLVRTSCWFRDGAAGPSEVSTFSVFEAAPDGRILREMGFEIDHLTEATATLEARWRELQALDEGNLAWQASLRQEAALAATDWDAFVATTHPSLVYIDVRHSLWVPADDPLAMYQLLLSLDEWALRRTLLETRGDRLALVRVQTTFSDRDAGPSEVSTFTVFEAAPDGRIERETSFDPDDLASATAALDARWEELEAEPPTPVPNRAWEIGESALQAFDRRDWEAFVDHFDPMWDFDQRHVPVSNRSSGPEAFAAMRVGFDLEATWERRLIATAGDRLALSVDLFRGTDGAVSEFEVESLTVIEVTADGLIRRRVAFDSDDVDAAMEELHERHRLLEDPLAVPRNLAVRSVAKPGWAVGAAIGEHVCLHDTSDGTIVHEVEDTGEVIAALSFGSGARRAAFDELVRRGYRRLGLPDSSLAMTRSVIAGDNAAVVSWLAADCTVEDHRRLRPADRQDADPYIIELLGSADTLAPDHTLEILRIEAADRDPWGQLAVVRLVGTTGDGAAFESPYISVVCWNASGLISDLALHEPDDIELARARLAAKRPVGRKADDPLAIPRNLAVRRVAKPGWARLAALGEHLCLHDTGDRLVLHEVDDEGEVTAFLAFDHGSRRGAFDELTKRAFDRAGAPAPSSGMVAAMNARDMDAFRDCLGDGCVVEDHRNLRVVPVETGDEYATAFTLFIELAQDYCVEMLRLDAVEPWGCVTLNRFTGTASDGGAFEIPTLACSTWDETGRTSLMALYEPADLDVALARLAQAAPA